MISITTLFTQTGVFSYNMIAGIWADGDMVPLRRWLCSRFEIVLSSHHSMGRIHTTARVCDLGTLVTPAVFVTSAMFVTSVVPVTLTETLTVHWGYNGLLHLRAFRMMLKRSRLCPWWRCWPCWQIWPPGFFCSLCCFVHNKFTFSPFSDTKTSWPWPQSYCCVIFDWWPHP